MIPLAQTLAWSALTALPIIVIAQLVGRLRVPARLKVWTCRFAFLKLALGLIPLGFVIRSAPQATQVLGAQNNPRFDALVLFLTGLWATGFVVVIIDLIKAYRASRTLLRAAEPSSSGALMNLALRARMPCPEVRRGETDGLPFASGILRPVIVVSVQPCPDSVLAHELAHVKSRDLMWNLFARFVLGIFWFTPFIHRLERELALWQEAAADIEACRLTECPLKAHASAIVISAARPGPAIVWEARLSGNAEIISRRLKALYQQRPSVVAGIVSLTLLLAAVLPLRVQAQPAKADSPRQRMLAELYTGPPIASPVR